VLKFEFAHIIDSNVTTRLHSHTEQIQTGNRVLWARIFKCVRGKHTARNLSVPTRRRLRTEATVRNKALAMIIRHKFRPSWTSLEYNHAMYDGIVTTPTRKSEAASDRMEK
jgi:hypothetical protein